MIEGEGRFFTTIRCDSSEEWLELRKQGVGGSDVAAILGLSKYKGAYALWAEKTGQVEAEDISDKPAVHWGNVLEPIVGEEYRSAHKDRIVRRVNAVCRSIERPWAQASLDYEVKDPELGWGILEVKTAGARVADDWCEGVPIYYQTQILHYMAVTGRPFADVAVLIGGSDYREYRILRDEADIASINAKVDEFWLTNVQKFREPEISFTPGDTRSVFALNSASNGLYEDAFDLSELVASQIRIKEALKDLEEDKKAVENQIKARVGRSKGIVTDQNKVTWVRSESTRFDTAKFKEENPDFYAKYTVPYLRDGGLRVSKAK